MRITAILIAVLMALLLSLGIAYYIRYPYPYMFATLNTAVVLVFLLAVSSSSSSISKGSNSVSYTLKIDGVSVSIALISGYIFLLITRYLELTIIAAVLTLIYYFVVGYSIIKLLKLEQLINSSESLTLSFITGFTYIGLIAFASTLLTNVTITYFILNILIVIHIIVLSYIFKRREINVKFSLGHISLLKWMLIFIIIFSFYAFYYAKFVYLPGTDISRHYMQSVNIIRNPQKFLEIVPDYYYLFHSSVGALILLSGEKSFSTINMVLIVVNIVYVLAIALFIDSVLGYRKSVDIGMTLLSVFVFTGLGWLYILSNPPHAPSVYFDELSKGNSKMYNNLMYVPSPFMWPVPLSFATATYLTSIAIILKIMRSRNNVKHSGFSWFLLGLILALAMIGIHHPEAVMHSLALFLVLLFVETKGFIAIGALCKGFIIGFTAGGLMNIVATLISPHPLTAVRVIAFMAPAVTVGLALPLRRLLQFLFQSLSHRITLTLTDSQKRVLAGTIVYAILGLFVVGILVALDKDNGFYTSLADPGGVIGFVPWFMYSILLGMVLPLSVIGLAHVLLHDSDPLVRMFTKVLLVIIAISIVLGRLTSYLISHGIDIGYWGEKRFIMFVYLALLPYALYALTLLGKWIRERRLLTSMLMSITLSILIMLSFSNTLVQSSFWNIYSTKYGIDKSEYEVLTSLRDILWNNTDRWILSPGIRSRDEAVFAAPIYATFADPSIDFRYVLPETALRILRLYGLGTPYIYVDWRTDSNTVKNGWIGSALLPSIATKLLGNDHVEVYDVPPLAPPLPNSSTALVLPPDRVLISSIDKVFLLLSRLELNYTTILELDYPLYNLYKTIILLYDPPAKGTLDVTIDALQEESIRLWRSVVGRVNTENGTLELKSERVAPENIITLWGGSSQLGPNTDFINVTMVFRVKDYDPNVLNYIHIVYDYRDRDNYRYLGIMVAEHNSKIYALNCSKIRGETICNPPWPGLYIGENFDVSVDHVLTIGFDMVRGIALLRLDSYRQIAFNIMMSRSALGVRIDRFKNIYVNEFIIDASIRTISLEKLLSLISRGNTTIIILNTLGYGEFYETLTKSNYSVLLRSNDVDVYLACIDNTTVIYLDLKSSLDRILRNDEVLKALREILASHIALFSSKSYRDSTALRANIVADSVISKEAEVIARDALLIPRSYNNICIANTCFNGYNIRYAVLAPSSSTELTLRASNISMITGNGFYAIIEVNNLTIPANTKVQVYLRNGSILVLELEKNATASGFIIVAKTPMIIAREAIITGVHYQGLKYPYLARDLVLKSNATLRYVIGDELLVLYAYADEVEFIKPLQIYDEAVTMLLIPKYMTLYVITLPLFIYYLKGLGVTSSHPRKRY